MSENIVIELIRFAAVIAGVVIPVVLGVGFFKWKSKQNRYRRKLKIALLDLRFLQAVEAEHVRNNQEVFGESNRRRIRNIALYGQNWSGCFTPSGIALEIERIERDEKGESLFVGFAKLTKG